MLTYAVVCEIDEVKSNIMQNEAVEYLVNNPIAIVDILITVVGIAAGGVGVATVTGRVFLSTAAQLVVGIVGLGCSIYGAIRLVQGIMDNISDTD